MNGAQSLIGTLVRSDVEVCFTNPGTSEMHFVAALDHEPDMRAVLVLFEGVATGAADGYARMSEKPAASLLHLGPGLANGLANLHNAKKARSPVVNIIGDHATYHQLLEAPLTSDVKAFAAPVSQWIKSSPNGAEVGHDAAAAVLAANSNGGQIASLILPADTAWTPAHDYGVYRKPPSLETPPTAAIEKISALLANGKKTSILMTGQALRARGLEAANRIAAKSGAQVFADTFNARTERGAGRYGIKKLPYFAEQIVETLAGTEQLIIVGSQSPVSFFAYPDIPNYLVPEGCATYVLATHAEDAIGGLEAVAEEIKAPQNPAGKMELIRPNLASNGDIATAVWAAMAHYMPDNSIVVDEATTSGLASEMFLANAPQHDYLQLTGGSIGIGLPLSLGASIACPDRKVICGHGDGGAMYTLQALWTQARENCDVVNIIFSNRKYMILEIEIMRVGAENVGPRALDMFDLSRPNLDWCQLANGMGVHAMRASSVDEVNEAMAHCMGNKGPHLIEVIV